MRQHVERMKGPAVVVVLAIATLLTGACGGPEPEAEPMPTPGETTDASTATPTNPGGDAASEPEFDAEAHFRGQTIRLLVGYNPGGGTDAQARWLAGHLPEYIPGNPRISVSNLTPNITASNRLWEAPPDGLTLKFNAHSEIAEGFDSAANYSGAEFTHVFGAVPRDAAWVISGDLPYDDIRDAIGADGPAVIRASSAPSPRDITGVTDLGALLLAYWLDIPFEFKPVADTGTAQQELMLERGDVNSIVAGSIWYQWPVRKPGWTTEGFVKPFVGMTPTDIYVEDNEETEWTAPQAWELDQLTEEQRSIWDGLIGADTFMGKNLMGPPGMRPEIRDVIYNAVQDLLSDPERREEFERLLGQPMRDYPNPDGLTEMWQEYENGFEENLPLLEELQNEVYGRYVR